MKWSHEAAVDIHFYDFQKRNCKTWTVVLNKNKVSFKTSLFFIQENFLAGGEHFLSDKKSIYPRVTDFYLLALANPFHTHTHTHARAHLTRYQGL